MCQQTLKKLLFFKALRNITFNIIEDKRQTLSNPSGILIIFK